MEKLGLHNVNGNWQGFDWSWLDDRSQWKDGKMQTPYERRNYKRRIKCDYCFLIERSAFSNTHKDGFRCQRVGNSNICLPCNKMGRPCSYTGLSYLWGRDDWRDEVNVTKTTKNDLHKAAAKALLNQPYADGALTVLEFEEKSGLVVMGGQEESHLPVHWNQLSALEQQSFTTWDGMVREKINAMGRLRPQDPAYQVLMSELQELVDTVATQEIPDMLRAYMTRKIEQEIFYFMINGTVRLRGG